jgi:hypothetical protein
VLGLVVKVGGVGVDFGQVTGQEGFLAVHLLGDDVAVDAAEEVVFGLDEEVFGRVPWAEGGGFGGLERFGGVGGVVDGVDGEVGGGGDGAAVDMGELVVLFGVVGGGGDSVDVAGKVGLGRVPAVVVLHDLYGFALGTGRDGTTLPE